VIVSRRRSSAGSVCSSRSGSVRVKPRRPVVTFNEPTYVRRATRYGGTPTSSLGRSSGDDVYVVNRQPRQVFMDDVQEFRVQPNRPVLGNIQCYMMDDPTPMPVMQFMQQPSNVYNYDMGGGGGGEFNFMSAPFQQPAPARRIVYNANDNPTVSCEIRPDQPQQEYVLTTVDGQSASGGTYPRGSAPMDGDDVDDIEVSDGSNSGPGNSFYPSLPNYEEADRKY